VARTESQNRWNATDKGKAYNVWGNMMHKCYDLYHTNYSYYGGRGITVDPRWHNFENFYADMGPAPAGMTIERTDNDLGYSLENCSWGTRQDQARNRRSNRVITFGDTTQSLAAWAEQTGINRRTISMRLANGWSVERALSIGGRHF
jgi:hypothetical protein